MSDNIAFENILNPSKTDAASCSNPGSMKKKKKKSRSKSKKGSRTAASY